ncbi:hypothetical protein L6R53_30985 [Myxococcota bacterium]|nr:hypothetical protein [Myxococcota bacterium]
MRAFVNKVVVVPFAQQYLLTSDGSQNWRYIELDNAQYVGWGPHLDSITAHTQTQTRTAAHRWKLVMWTSIDGKTWSTTPVDLFANPITANGDLIHPPFSDKSWFGIHIKLGLAVSNSSGTAIESAVVTAVGAFEFKS